MIEVTCTSCGKRYRVDDKYAGREVPCSACGGTINIVASPPQEEEQDIFDLADTGDNPDPHTAFDPSTSDTPNTSSGQNDAPNIDITIDHDNENINASADLLGQSGGPESPKSSENDRLGTAIESPQIIEEPAPRSMSPLGIASLALGSVSLAAAYFLGHLTLPASGLGFILGLVGLVIATKKQRHNTKMPIAAIATCAIAFILPFVMPPKTPDENQSAIQELPSNQAVVQNHNPQSPAEMPPPTSENRGPAYVGDSVVKGNAQISIMTVKVAPVTLLDQLTQQTEKSTDVVMAVQIRINNLSDTSALDYASWAGQPKGYKRDFGEVIDQDNNGYQRRMYGENTIPVGRLTNTSIAPGTAATDILLFKRPPANVQYLDLMLPGENIGSHDIITFRITADVIEK